MGSCCVASQAVISGSVVISKVRSISEIQHSSDAQFHVLEQRLRHALKKAAPRADQSTLFDCSIMTHPPGRGTDKEHAHAPRAFSARDWGDHEKSSCRVEVGACQYQCGRVFACSRPACGSKLIQARPGRLPGADR